MKSLPYQVDYAHSLAPPARLEAAVARLTPAIQRIKESPLSEAASILHQARREDDLPAIEALAKAWRNRFSRLVVVGCGGSGLSGYALSILRQGRMPANPSHSLLVIDNLDMSLLTQQLSELDLSRCCFLLVSKSGSTPETMAQAEVILQALDERGLSEHGTRMAAISKPSESPLRALVAQHNLPFFEHDVALCGRFSILSSVGLIPAAFLGIDIRLLRDGAQSVLENGIKDAAKGAALQVIQEEAARNVSVFMPYSERLFGLAQWWRQAFAESLGKQGKGATPFVALGTADQHSQLQLFLDGPRNKYFTILLTDCEREGSALQGGYTLGDLQAAEQRATVEALCRNNRPVRVIRLRRADERSFGALIMHLTLEILFIAELLGINPFDQPAVEESKRLARLYLLGEL